jgi:hypothetical protein
LFSTKKTGRRNQAQGKAGEDMADLVGKIHLQQRIPTGIGSDFLVIEPDGRWYLVDEKTGPHARLTKRESEVRELVGEEHYVVHHNDTQFLEPYIEGEMIGQSATEYFGMKQPRPKPRDSLEVLDEMDLDY